MSKKPRKDPRPKLRKVNVSPRSQWRNILKEINKDEIPIDLLLCITVNLVDGSRVDIDVKELLADGQDPKLLEEMLDNRFKLLDNYIEDINFYVSIEKVAETVQPITDEILKDL